jgi:hypothetical protein
MKIIKDEFEAAFPDDAFDFKNIRNRINNENVYLYW